MSFPTGGNLQPSPQVTKSSRLSLDICPTEMSAAQFSSVTQSCLTLCDLMDCSTPGLPVHHQFQELTQTHVHRVGDATQPAHMFTKGMYKSASRSLLQNSLEVAQMPPGKKMNKQQPYSHTEEHCFSIQRANRGCTGHRFTSQTQREQRNQTQKGARWGLPGGPVAKTLPANAGGGLDPWGAAKIPLASRPKSQNIKQKQCCSVQFRHSVVSDSL